MDAIGCTRGFSFGEAHFGSCDFGDARLTRRAVTTADLLLRHPGGTLPEKLNDNAALIGLYRLANNPKVSHAAMLRGHFRQTRQRMEGCGSGVVLIVHDTTELDFSGLESVEDLGPIGNGGCAGFLCHNSLAVEFATRRVLGLSHQAMHTRRRVPKGESPKAKRQHPQRESKLWVRGLEGIEPAPPQGLWVHLTDRGGDTFEFIDRCRARGEKYLVRSKSNRNIELRGEDGTTIKAKLHDYARRMPTLCTRAVNVQANGHHQSERQTTVRVAAAPIHLHAPHYARGEHGKLCIQAWVIHVLEINPPEGVAAMEWILLTNVPTTGAEQAGQRVDWYQCRPIVEEYHKAQKTGCGIELPQFTTRRALEATAALLSVVAVHLLNLRDLSRRDDAGTTPATAAIDTIYIQVLSAWRFKRVRVDLSVHEFCLALAKLGGHLNRKCDHPPGWLVLWRGWSQLQLLVQGALSFREARCV
jgi:hypothetical protein